MARGTESHKKGMTMTQKFDQVAVIVADGEVDSVQDWAKDSVQHVKDLRAMGCHVKVRIFGGQGLSKMQAWQAAEFWADKQS